MEKISIVTVTYNCCTEIEETIKSVIYQTYADLEYIIIDGKSTDGTIETLRNYNNQITFWKSEQDLGIFDAMNKALDHCTGEWILFMNAGDTFADNDLISKIFSTLFDETVGVIYGNTLLNDQGRISKHLDIPFYLNKSKVSPMGICHQSIFVRAKLAQAIKFDLNFKFAADFKMIKCIYDQKINFVYKDINVSCFKLNGVTSNNTIKQFNEVAMINNQYKTIYYYIYLIKIIAQTWKKKVTQFFKSLVNEENK